MKLSQEDAIVLGKAVASLLIGSIIWCGLKYAFDLTWFQAFMISWLYCILRDAVIHSKN
jgi:hypothetical protein